MDESFFPLLWTREGYRTPWLDEYMELASIANPHARLVYHTPEGETRDYPRTYHKLPPQPREIKPHPYGIEFGMLLKMLHDTKSRWLTGFLTADFSRVSPRVAAEVCKPAELNPRARPRGIRSADVDKLYKAIQSTKIMAPPTNCISPIGEKAVLHGLYKQIKGEFYTAVTRPPAVYRGNPFVIEAGLAYGKGPQEPRDEHAKKAPLAEGELGHKEAELARVIRYANRVPLLYQQSACATFQSVIDTTWRNYGVSQSRGALPAGPMVIFVHMASVWVPFTSESKEAIADYDEIRKETRLALQECGRRLNVFLRRRERARHEHRRRNIFELYVEVVAEACRRLKDGKLPVEKLKKQLQKIAMRRTGGEQTDELSGDKKGMPEGLPHSIIMTPEGPEGEVPRTEGDGPPAQEAAEDAAPGETAGAEKEPSRRKHAPAKAGRKGRKRAPAKAGRKGRKRAPAKAGKKGRKPARGSRRSKRRRKTGR